MSTIPDWSASVNQKCGYLSVKEVHGCERPVYAMFIFEAWKSRLSVERLDDRSS